MEYTTPDGTKILLVADQFVLSKPSSRCEVSGPSTVLLICDTRIVNQSYDDSIAHFGVWGKGDLGKAPLPTVTCDTLRDPGHPGDDVSGEACSGVPPFFDGPAT